jgi:hypothetical protein
LPVILLKVLESSPSVTIGAHKTSISRANMSSKYMK